MYLLEVAMCEKCRSSPFQLEGGVKSLRTVGAGGKKFLDWRGYFWGVVSTPLHAIV